MTARVIHSECLDWLRTQPDNSIDAIVTDPPYGLSNHTPKAIRECLSKWLAGETYTHKGGGFMGKEWDAFVPGPEVWAECLRVLKPGGYALVFAGTRTVDIMGIALRLGGFEIRDSLSWMYGSGFPKSLSLGRATDDGRRFEPYGTSLKPAHEPIIVARKPLDGTHAHNAMKWGTGGVNVDGCRVASNGDHKRGVVNGAQTGRPVAYAAAAHGGMSGDGFVATDHPAGRWPPNVVLSHAVGCHQVGTRAVKGDARNGGGVRPSGFADVGSTSGNGVPVAADHADPDGNERVDVYECVQGCPVGELSRQSGERPGTAARFFPTFDPPFQYVAKASRAEREAGCEHLDAVDRADLTGRKPDSAGLVGSDGSGNNPYCGANYKTPIRNTHPTVKPARGLMTWLVRLVTPPNPDAVILDPFCGSGSTGIACVIERVNFVGVDLDEHHVEIARARIAHAITDAGLTAQDIEDTTTADKDVVTATGPAQVCLF
jgi:site-specific DNA-methyltransferase (adenine-specific)